MKPTEALEGFSKFAASHGAALSASTPREGIEQMFSFYQAVRAEGCIESGGDSLLFQWGTYDWGDGLHFELDITRQFYEQFAPEDNAISQLNLTYRFEPTTELEALGKGTRWCDGLGEVDAFRDFVHSAPVFAALADRSGLAVRLTYSYV